MDPVNGKLAEVLPGVLTLSRLEKMELFRLLANDLAVGNKLAPLEAAGSPCQGKTEREQKEFFLRALCWAASQDAPCTREELDQLKANSGSLETLLQELERGDSKE
jgi:hypothetical protein